MQTLKITKKIKIFLSMSKELLDNYSVIAFQNSLYIDYYIVLVFTIKRTKYYIIKQNFEYAINNY